MSSLLEWYPTTKNLCIPQPRTEILELENSPTMYQEIEETNFACLPWDKIKETAAKIGYPLFFRTDQASHKHGWKMGSFIEKPEDLRSHVSNVIEFNHMADIMGLPYKALVFREYIKMDGTFTAFYGDMPVNSERRYFASNGLVICHHPYWPEYTMQDASVPDWKERLSKLNFEDSQEQLKLSKYAEMVSQALPNADWSIDFCRDATGKWWLIDMAHAKMSFHLLGCKQNRWNYAEMERCYSEKAKSNEVSNL